MQTVYMACGGDNNYALGIVVAVHSLIQNLSTDVQLVCYLLDGGILPAVRERIHATLSEKHPEAEFIWVDYNMDRFGTLYADDRFTKSVFLRLLLPEKIKDRADKVLYIDSDTLVVGNVLSLYNTAFDAQELIAVQDFNEPTLGCTKYKHIHGINRDAPALNSGVLMMDIQSLQSSDIIERTFNALTEHSALGCHDQDGLNIVLQGRWKKMPLRYNMQIGFGWRQDDSPESEQKTVAIAAGEKILSDAVIVHFTGWHKPWNSYLVHPIREKYDRTLASSGWFTPSQQRRWQMERAQKAIMLNIRRNLKAMLRGENWGIWDGVSKNNYFDWQCLVSENKKR